jgi:hypothetical protein
MSRPGFMRPKDAPPLKGCVVLPTSAPVLTARNADLSDLVELLRDQRTRRLDVVAGAAAIHAEGARLRISDTDPILTPDGVSSTSGLYTPTGVCDEGLADKLGIPRLYLRKLREQAPDLFDANVNSWLRRQPERRFLIRCLRGNDGGVARAFLSDGYKIIDNLDVLTSALQGMSKAGIGGEHIDSCDLTERRMHVRVVCEQVRVLAPQLLAGYRSPFTGAEGSDNPVVFAGFVISNSEVGGGAFTITPRLVVKVCRNGMTINIDALREVHLGGRLEQGVIRWSQDTQERNLELIALRARDAVATFMNTDYLAAKIEEISQTAGRELAEPDKTIRYVATQLRFTTEESDQVLRHFIKGGSMTTGGVMHAVTSAAQTMPDAERAYEMEGQALRALHLAAAH